MDTNGNNNEITSVSESEYSVKIEGHVEPPENAVLINKKNNLILLKFNEKFEKKLKDVDGKKRKNSEGFVDMELEDSQNSSNESVKRRRYSDTQKDKNSNSYIQDSDRKEISSLLITDTLGGWSFDQTVNFVKNDCEVSILQINDSSDRNTETNFQIHLQFDTKKELCQVLKKLQQKESEGKLTVYIDDLKDDSESDSGSDVTLRLQEWDSEAESDAGLSKQTRDFNSDSSDFYIRREYLESLGIKLPLTNWVFVTNFRCDKTELRDVLELAGNVLVCSVCTISSKYANVMYSHPLEAVQAVSMLNGHKYYGQTLKVTMTNIVGEKTLLPKGLNDVGPGLGKWGKPLPNLGEQYKLFLKGKSSNLDACLFQQSLLKKLGITPTEEMTKFVRKTATSNSQSNCDADIDRNESPIGRKSGNDVNQGNEFGPIGQEMSGKNIPVIRTQIHKPSNKVNSRGPLGIPIHNSFSSGHNQGPHLVQIRPVRPIVPMGTGLIGLRGPGFPIAPNSPGFSNCPPIPGLEIGPPTAALNGMTGPRPIQRVSGPSPVGHVGPRGPMPSPNRFSGPVNPIMGPRPVTGVGHHGSIGMVPNGPMIQTHSFATNVQMFKCPDPVMVQIINLPPTTNFVNLGQKLSELGHVVFLELTTPGCANVRFASPADADRCLQNYHKVMG